MNFGYTPEQDVLRAMGRDLAEQFDEAYWQMTDEQFRFPEEFWQGLVDRALLGTAIPAEYGGSGLGLLELVVLAESLAEHGAGMDGPGLLVAGPIFGGYLFSRHGSEDQRHEFLPAIVNGETWAGAFTESDAGSNVSALTTRAELVDGEWVIHGSKMFVSMMQRAAHVVVLARTGDSDSGPRQDGISLLYADLPDSRIEARPMRKLGSHFMDTSSVFLDGVTIPRGNVVGGEGHAWGKMFDVLNPERILLAAVSIGTGMLAIERAAAYADRDRRVWDGRAIGSHQGVQFPLAEAKIALSGARLKVYEAAWLYDQGSPACGTAATMAKYSASHAALDAADRAIQTLGGAGYLNESGVERHWRNLRLNRLAPITDEMALAFIAQHDLDLPRSY